MRVNTPSCRKKETFKYSCFQNEAIGQNLVTSIVYKCQRAGFPNLACDQQVAPATRIPAKLLTGAKNPRKPFEFTTQAWKQQAKRRSLHLITRQGRELTFLAKVAEYTIKHFVN